MVCRLSSSFIAITASDSDPQRAWLLADGYARGFIADLTYQTEQVAQQQLAELKARTEFLQQQLAAVPSAANNARLGSTFGPAQDRVDFFEHLRRLTFHVERFVIGDSAGKKYQIAEDRCTAIPFTRIDSFDIHGVFPFLMDCRATPGRR